MLYPNLEAEMKRMNYTRDNVAKALDCSVSAVYKMLSGKQRLTISQAMKLRDELLPGLPVDYLFDLSPQCREK